MPSSPLFDLFDDLWQDLQNPQILWQVLAIAVCLGLAKLAERIIVRKRPSSDESAGWKIGHGGLKRVIFPLVGLVLIDIARHILHGWISVRLLALALPLLFSLAVIRVVFFTLRHTFSQSAWLRSFERWFATLVWLGVAAYITGLDLDIIDFLDDITFVIGKQKYTLWLLIQGAATVAIALLAALWIGGLIESRLAHAEGMDANLRIMFSRLAKALLVTAAVLLALSMVGIDLTTLSVFGGALGVGLGFGLQKIASNYVSGFIILIDRSIRIGNLIEVAGDRGQVTLITSRYTVLRNAAGVEALVPNETLVSSTVHNETYSDPLIWVKLPVQVAYSTDLDAVLPLLCAIANEQARVAKTPPAQAYVTAFADSGINLELGFWIADPENGTRRLISDINLGIWRAFREHGIEIPYPQREVRLLGNTP